MRVHLLFHRPAEPPREKEEPTRAHKLAMHLLELLNGPTTDWGPRIPVEVGALDDWGCPLEPRPAEDERRLIVILIDSQMAGRGTPAEQAVADAWAALVEDLLEKYPPGVSHTCSVLPVAVDGGALTLSPRLDQRSFVRLDVNDERHLEFHVAIAGLRLMQGLPGSAGTDMDELSNPDIKVFISHAKVDLPSQEPGPVRALLGGMEELPLKKWLDSSDIPPGANFTQEIKDAVAKAAAVIVVLTDNYSSREWCRREVLAAKAVGRPIVVVDAIESQVVRLFPYIGNAPTVRWRAALAKAGHPPITSGASGASESSEGKDVDGSMERQRRLWERQDASTVVLVTLLEALRQRHELARLSQHKQTGDGVLGTHPEMLTVAAATRETTHLLYPDPPLGNEEAQQLTQARSGIHLVTPLERLVAGWAQANGRRIAVSLSGSPDALKYGGSDIHLATMAHDLALYLLLTGHRLVYGGVLGHGALVDERAPGDTVNYVDRLIELVARHSPLAQQVGRPLAPIENWLAWPMHLELSRDDRDKYVGGRAVREEIEAPADIPEADKRLGSDGRYPRKTSAARYVRSRCLTAMREQSTAAISARLAMGGKLNGYMGTIPGIAEEVLLTLRAGRPLYLVGAFGGATRMVIDLLSGRHRPEATSSWCQDHVEGWTDLIAEYQHRGTTPLSPEGLANELQQYGAVGLTTCLNNGLTLEQNEELMATTDSQRAVELVLVGLHATGGPTQQLGPPRLE